MEPTAPIPAPAGLDELVSEARRGDVGAFTEIVRRHQHLAFASAVSLLGDFHLAQDATQDAFVTAYARLDALRDPRAFPGWLRGIVRNACRRVRRRRDLEFAPLDDAFDLAASGPRPDEAVSAAEQRRLVLDAVRRLPQPQREVLTLFYLREHAQRDVATFLGVPVTTVNNRLHAARAMLRRALSERVMNMVAGTLSRNRLPDDFADNLGRVLRVQGPVVEARFGADDVPHILDSLTISDDDAGGAGAAGWVKVVQRREGGVVRCVATTPLANWSPGCGWPTRRRSGTSSRRATTTSPPPSARSRRRAGRLPPLPMTCSRRASR
jgi:RNA polymerase sigma factor (sigma-70 family)